jgi:carbon-monoxide dehydrogenase small subunit
LLDDISIRAKVNGEEVCIAVPARQSLADFLRETLRLTGTHLGCEHGVCGACSVVIDGDVVRSCLCLAAQIDGKVVETIEGASDRGVLDALQSAFAEFNAAQCGFCTPGMLLTANELLSHFSCPDRQEIRDYISGNFCRCTGYHAIVDAIERVARASAKSGEA